MRKVGTLVCLIALIAPLSAFALTQEELVAQINALLQQIATLQAQVKTTSIPPVTTATTPAANLCAFPKTLALGASGPEVTDLQTFLEGQGALNSPHASGTYDESTQIAVQTWQASHGIVSSGTPETTGFGRVGPKTRSIMALNCTVATNQTPSCPLAPKPATSCPGTWNSVTNDNGCTIGWRCSVPLPQAVQAICTTVALTCPLGTHLQVSPSCAQACIPGSLVPEQAATTSSPTCSPLPIVECAIGYRYGGDIINPSGCHLRGVCLP